MHQNPSQRLNLKISTGKGLNVLHISQTQTWRRKGFRIFDIFSHIDKSFSDWISRLIRNSNDISHIIKTLNQGL